MNKNNVLFSAVVASGLVAIFASAAQAAMSVSATFNNVSPSRNVEITHHNVYRTPATTATVTSKAGKFNWTGTSAANTALLSGSFVTFCMDYNQSVSGGTNYTYAVTDLANGPVPNGPGQGNPFGGLGANAGLGTTRTKDVLLKQLWAAFYNLIGTNADRAAAFQLSVWKIIYENDVTGFTTMTAGDFKVTGGSVSGSYVGIANNHLSFLAGNPNAAQEAKLVALTHPTAQDQLAVIPEPGSLGLLVPALMLLGRRR